MTSSITAGHRLHTDALVADAHNDLLMLVVRRSPQRWATYFRDVWYPQLRAGGVDLQVLPVFIDHEFTPEGALRESLRMVEAAHRIAEGNPDLVALCRTGAEIDTTIGSGRIALVLALEGCPQIDTDVELLQTFARLGVRIVSFTHFGRTALADGSGEDPTGSRLTRAGVEALALLESLGVAIDVSHLGATGIDHVLELATRPVIATHSCSRSLHDHHRNLSDDHIRGIAATGGLICVNLYAGYLTTEPPTLDHVVAHIERITELAGPTKVGIGADFVADLFAEKIPTCDRPLIIEGTNTEILIPGLEGPSGLPLVSDALLTAGHHENEVRGIAGVNLARFLGATHD
ncbi:membrane dipeptidase [Prauserella sp. PE36]|uniref:dipeptidase n=1 Tax=Prauserella sp. PE36 TaxID=1504709 RepID=UPI000DE5600E|nr:membrane dipeptidase [Prauserella sp. PE36]RBM17951.1 membrane dipeptidase [Prauserella sp. PE36]